MKEILNYLFEGHVLTQEKAKETLINIGSGKYSNEEIAAFLTVFQMRKITPEELLGFREAMINLAIQVDLHEFDTIDVCGTGGDGKNTFNISTLSAFILAGSGIKVVKHGNYGLSSPCGSSNIFEHFGYQFSTDTAKLKKELETCNICYLHAPIFHPAMKHVGPVRKALKVKTFFNMLGPLINPARPKSQFVGVFSTDVQKKYAEVFKLTDAKYGIVFSNDGYDEISLTGDFSIINNTNEMNYSPELIGLNKTLPEQLHGGNTIEDAASIFLNILEGKGTRAQNDVVISNSAFAMKIYAPEKSLDDCLEISRDSLLKGKALQIFKQLFNK